jgi:hypothetical protein
MVHPKTPPKSLTINERTISYTRHQPKDLVLGLNKTSFPYAEVKFDFASSDSPFGKYTHLPPQNKDLYLTLNKPIILVCYFIKFIDLLFRPCYTSSR